MLKLILQYFLKIFAKKILGKYHPDIIGITGSVGKTSSKEAIIMVLKGRFNVRGNYKNYNNEIGLPLTIIGVDQSPGKSIFGWLVVFWQAIKLSLIRCGQYPDILVLEMGADKPGDIRYLTEIAPCKVGVLTGISHAHTEFFKTIKKISQEKRVIITHLDSDGFAVLNFDNEHVMENRTKTKAEVITYGFKEGADLRASDAKVMMGENDWPSGLNFKVSYHGNIIPVFLSGVIAEHLIYSALSALAVGVVFGINLVEAAEELKKLKPLAGHMRILPGIKNTLIIDDTYNSSPEAARSALDTLGKIIIKPNSKKYAVLGDMLELGPETENAHREIGLKVGEVGVDFLITVGEASKHTALAAKEAGLEENQVAVFSDSISAGKFLQEKLHVDDVVLIKGSQGSRMERVVKEVMAEPLRADELLVRQGKGW